MPETAAPILCALFALQVEAVPLLRRLTGKRYIQRQARRHSGVLGSLNGRTILVAWLGVGAQQTERNLLLLLKNMPGESRAQCILSLGFAGGLSPEAAPGALIVASSVGRTAESGAAGNTLQPGAIVMRIAQSISIPGTVVGCGHFATSRGVLCTSAQKIALGTATGATVVEMESAEVARIAEDRGIPWLAVRAVSDGVLDDMPLDFNRLSNSAGEVTKTRVAIFALTHPKSIPALVQLARRCGQAARNLAAFAEAFSGLLPDGTTQ